MCVYIFIYIYAAGHTCIFSSSSSLYPDNSVCSQYDRTSRTCNICAWIYLDTLYVFTLLYTVHSDVTGDFSNRSPTAPVTSQETLGSCQLERLVETGPWCARPWSRQCSILSIPVMLQMCFASVINLSIWFHVCTYSCKFMYNIYVYIIYIYSTPLGHLTI